MCARRAPVALLFTCLLGMPGCFRVFGSEGGGQTSFEGPRMVDAAAVALPDGYRIEPILTGLTFPTGVSFDDDGRVHVLEAGYSYGEAWATPRLLRVEPDGSTAVVATGEHPPWNGIDFADGSFFVAEGGQVGGGRIIRIESDGSIGVLVDDLPGLGDHHTNGPVVAPDDWVYFGQGTATNSGVVGLDNARFGWLFRHPDFHDIPCRDVTLLGRNFTTSDPRTDDPEDSAVTGAFSPFGTPTDSGRVIPGEVPCSGAVLRVRIEGGDPELVAWGLRNPFGFALDPEGGLHVVENSYDVRGSRPVFGTGDPLWRIEPGTWYGWPDFHAGRPLTDEDAYRPPGEPAPGFLLAEHPGEPPEPIAVLGVHSSSNGFDFSRGGTFGYDGEAFVAQFGDMSPGVGKVMGPVGFKVVRVDVESGVVRDFAVNRGDRNGPASLLGTGGLERPVAARFAPGGDALYVVDFGVMTIGAEGPQPRAETGVLWRVTRISGEEP